MNLLMIAPLRDSRGEVRYHIGAQVDVSGIVKECTDLGSLRRLVQRQDDPDPPEEDDQTTHAFRELSEMFNMHELDTVRRCGGRMHKDMPATTDLASSSNWQRPRLMINELSPDPTRPTREFNPRSSGQLGGVYHNVRFVLGTLSLSPFPPPFLTMRSSKFLTIRRMTSTS